MRTLEIALFLLSTLDGASRMRLSAHRPNWMSVIPVLAFIVWISHAASEGLRWQMIPVYGVVLYTFTITLIRAFKTDHTSADPTLSRLGGGVIVGLSILSMTAATAMPVYTLPSPLGDYSVGRRAILLDHLTLGVHYPTDASSSQITAAYSESERTQLQTTLSDRFHLPTAFLSHLDLIATETQTDVGLSEELPRYRVLIEQPDAAHTAVYTLSLVEDLASRGFIVITVTPATDTKAPTAEEVVERLESLDPTGSDGWLADRMDLGRVGLFGFGEAGSIVRAAESGSFRAAAVVGTYSGHREATLPVLYLSSEGDANVSAGGQSVTYVCTVRGALSENFNDFGYVTPFMPILGAFGSIHPARAGRITRSYLGAFFNKHLTRGTVEPLLDGPTDDFPEVAIHIHDPRE